MNTAVHILKKKGLAFLPCALKSMDVLSKAVKGEERASERLPLKLQVEITDKCNFNCIMCDRHTLKQVRSDLGSNDISYETFSALIEAIQPAHVTLDGVGEPFLHKSLPEFLECCRARKILTSVFTNLSLADNQMISLLVKNPPDILNVSMHAATSQHFCSITASDCFNRFINNMEIVLRKTDRIKTTINIICALQVHNIGEYEAMFGYLKKWGMLERFVLAPVYVFESLQGEARIAPSLAAKKQALEAINQTLSTCVFQDKKKFLIRWRNVINDMKSLHESNETGPCLIPWFYAYVTVKGDVLPCCYLTDEHFVMGNIHRNSFSEIWNGNEYKKFRESIKNNRRSIERCKRCPRNDSSNIKKYRMIACGKSAWLV